MYIFDKEKNELVSAENTSFKELNLKERQHLQEWIAKDPSVLKEELLVIQKEFDGFSDTHERLDLLALDKAGNIVVIENKLDDSGRDVTWQAIKYASYCSSLKKDDIVAIYTKFLESDTSSAVRNMTEFFDVEDLDDMELNKENTQRIIFVAANFRKEVTSSVLWLRGFGIDASCVKVSPYKYDGKIMVDFDKIIPVIEAEEYTIKMAEKKKEEASQSVTAKRNKSVRTAFWDAFIEYNQKVGGDYASSSGTSESWLGKGGIGLAGVQVNIVITKALSRTEVYFNTGEKPQNKHLFDFFVSHKAELEKELGELLWERLDDKVTCRISQSMNWGYTNEEKYEEIFAFFVERTKAYKTAFSKVAKRFKK